MKSGEMLWECNSLLASEVWPEKILQQFLYDKDWISRKRVYSTLSDARLPNDYPQAEQEAANTRSGLRWPQTGSRRKMSLLIDWYKVVMPQVQVSELTYISDKLPCIQGLAELFKKAIGHDYLAGHWELSLIESLDWVSPWPHLYNMASHTNTTPVAPSWSVASVNGKTSYHESNLEVFPVAEFLGVSNTTVSNGSTAMSALCRLRIKGHAHRLGMDVDEFIFGSETLLFSPGSSWLPELWPSRYHVAYSRQDDASIYADSHQSYKMEASIQRHEKPRFQRGQESAVTVREDSALFLVILTIHRGDRSSLSGTCLSGIVTRQISEESDGPVFERIGQWTMPVPRSKVVQFENESFRDCMKQTSFFLV